MAAKVKEATKVSTVKNKKTNKTKEAGQTREGKNVRLRIRLLPIWLRIILVILFMAIALVVGAVIGYSVIGDGNAVDTLKKETWQHVIDLVEKE
ncbi:DNA-directed RNA polymerase subunit beta [Metabacillus arenae]|uniref:DNA-directed RNA polymerase subunit beta n=1 Tax=Metabacillus arenae TaxID=2771434 RepID=UPI001CD0E4C1|nr:DNA-directed RNA polymerase subunit beta [Metabacillus arenae]